MVYKLDNIYALEAEYEVAFSYKEDGCIHPFRYSIDTGLFKVVASSKWNLDNPETKRAWEFAKSNCGWSCLF